jgi:hypothetical protein
VVLDDTIFLEHPHIYSCYSIGCLGWKNVEVATGNYNNIICLLVYGKQARNFIAHHDIDKQAESSLVYTLRYALVHIIFIIVMRVLAGGRKPCCNHGSKGISVHSEEQHTGREDSRFDCFKLSCL